MGTWVGLPRAWLHRCAPAGSQSQLCPTGCITRQYAHQIGAPFGIRLEAPVSLLRREPVGYGGVSTPPPGARGVLQRLLLRSAARAASRKIAAGNHACRVTHQTQRPQHVGCCRLPRHGVALALSPAELCSA
eukprot:362536-Chlamydomonas_euryale.AAC.2